MKVRLSVDDCIHMQELVRAIKTELSGIDDKLYLLNYAVNNNLQELADEMLGIC